MKLDEQLLWQYIEGACTPEEKILVADLIEKDAVWKEEWAMRKALHEQLPQVELEAPSMRFSQNIMDRIAALSPIKIQPLIKAKTAWIFGLCFILFVVLFLTLLNGNSPVNSEASKYPNLQALLQIQLPVKQAILLGSVSLGFCLLFLFDQQLQKRSQAKAN